MGQTRLATALGNFEQGDIEAESAVVAQWLTSRIRVAMSRTGWNLLSPRYTLTKVPAAVLSASIMRMWQNWKTTFFVFCRQSLI